MNQQNRAVGPSGQPSLKTDVVKLYEDGKHRRYSLLFAVNGGALAIAKLFADENYEAFLRDLSVSQVAWGMAAFTLVLGYDIYMFGIRMRKAAGDAGLPPGEGLFNLHGRLVLVLLCLLIIIGWLRVA